MSASVVRREEAVLDGLVPQLEAEGFSVFRHPSSDILPPFLDHYRPDAVAFRGEERLAVEVLAGSRGQTSKLEALQQLFLPHPEWKLRVFYAPTESGSTELQALSSHLIAEKLREIENSAGQLGGQAALLLAWAAFEASGRRLLPAGLARPQATAPLIETLAADGWVTPDEADALRKLGQLRDAVAHGRLDVMPEQDQVATLVSITRSLLGTG